MRFASPLRFAHPSGISPAEVFIQTAARNALQYLVDSALGFLQRSLREQ